MIDRDTEARAVRLRNTLSLIAASDVHAIAAEDAGLMRTTITRRRGKTVTLDDGREVVEFVNCSYLGFDVHPKVIGAAQDILAEWGVHFCCARSRFTIDANRALEEELGALWGGVAITFPSVTAAHLSALPLAAAGVLLHRMRA